MRRPLDPQILFLVIVTAVGLSACMSQPESSDSTSSGAVTSEVPEPNPSNDIFFYDPEPPECDVEGSVTDDGVVTTIGEDAIGYGDVTVHMADNTWIKTVYTVLIYPDAAGGWLTMTLTRFHDDISRVSGVSIVAAYPEEGGNLWTEYHNAHLESDGIGGTLEATFSYKNDPSTAQIEVDMSFTCEDENPPVNDVEW